MQYDETTTFNESNVIHFLAELEEYISLFVTYLAYKQEVPDAALASLSLDTMPLKDHTIKADHVEAKQSTDVNYQEDLETEDEIVTDPRQLFKMYEEYYRKEHQD
jgi:hypothetical protein